ncbi:MAG: HAD-IIB family hydrolase [Myxococcales bacterium]|nr:HAD-IIB family hydrolase [Myxococcales bacterium]
MDLSALPRPLLVALDVDGTLAPIVDDPATARIPDETRRILRRLARRDDLVVALVTGRDLRMLERMAGRMPGMWRAVEHGARVIAPGERAHARPLTADERARLDAFASFVRESPGRLERKPRAVALHVRGLDEPTQSEWLARGAARASALGLAPRLGRAVLEAELGAPDGADGVAGVADKGRALAVIHARTGARAVFFAGDDLTDLPAITYAQKHGVGAFVESPERTPPTGVPTLASPAALGDLLATLSA